MILVIGSVQGLNAPGGEYVAPLHVGQTVPAESKYELYRQDILGSKQKMLEVLKEIVDPAAASAAMPKLEVLHAEMEASREKHIGGLIVSVRDEYRVKNRYEVQTRVIDTALHLEISRLRVQGVLSDDLKEALNAFGGSSPFFPAVAYATDPAMAHAIEAAYRQYFYELMAILEEMNVVLASVKDTASADAAAPSIAALRERQKKAEDRLGGRTHPDIAGDRVRMPDEYLFSRMESVWGDALKRIGQNEYFDSSELAEALDGISISY